jgi:hypothetical protein
MSCMLCGSGNQTEFPAEMIIHFSGLKNLDKPGVWAFPKLLVCLDCGSSQFTVSESELALLADGAGTKRSLTPVAEC